VKAVGDLSLRLSQEQRCGCRDVPVDVRKVREMDGDAGASGGSGVGASAIPIVIGQAPSSDFNDPLGLMQDCHRRIERFLHVLSMVTNSRRGEELSADERDALETALRYFRKAGPLHNADEETSLFPRMRGSEIAEAAAALSRMDHLEAEHRITTACHEEVDVLGAKWLQQGTLSREDSVRLCSLLEKLDAIYQQHIALEESSVFPLAASCLPADAIAAIGQEMASRRDVDSLPLSATSRCAARRAGAR
jgi:hemerythrin-like domain-containing protein